MAITLHTLHVKGSAADVVVFDDTESFVAAMRGELGGEVSENIVPCEQWLPILRKRQCVNAVKKWLADVRTGGPPRLLVVVDNFMPEENTGRELAKVVRDMWLVIASHEAVNDESIANPCYLGWVHKSRVPEFGVRVRRLLAGEKADRSLVAGLQRPLAVARHLAEFNALKHRLCNLFSSPLLDLRVARDLWCEPGRDERSWDALRASFAANSGQPQYYQQILDAAQAVTVGEPSRPNVAEDPDGNGGPGVQSLLEIARIGGAESTPAWDMLTALLGLQRFEGAYRPSASSPISVFWRRLDEAKETAAGSDQPVQRLLEFGFGSQHWGCEALPAILTIDDWFAAVEDALSELGQRLLPNGSAVNRDPKSLRGGE